jgi:hypothetical protein
VLTPVFDSYGFRQLRKRSGILAIFDIELRRMERFGYIIASTVIRALLNAKFSVNPLGTA